MTPPMPPPWAEGYGFDAFGPFAEIFVGDVCQRFRWAPPGRFMMGSPADEADRFDREVQHPVELTQGFWLADTPVTQALWTAVMGENPSRYVQPDRPVEQVSWDDAQAFIARLNQHQPGLDAALPTEAQWEYACRAGTPGARYGELDDVAWWSRNSSGQTHPLGQKQPNPWGLYDTLGNVWEWCADWWGSHETTLQVDPAGPAGGSYRVVRGGSWNLAARDVRAAYRGGGLPGDRDVDLGFRLSRGQAAPSPR